MSKATTPNVRAEALFQKHPGWRPTLTALYQILRNSELEETVRWGVPTWTHKGSIVVSLVAFKPYAGLWFHQGALLDDPLGVLAKPEGSNIKAQRQWRFKAEDKLSARKVNDYLRGAIRLAEQGIKVAPEKGRPVEIPPVLAAQFRFDETLKASFEALSLSKRREYAEYVA